MPLVTDPRQIVSPLPASLMKEVLDGLPSGPSASERTGTPKVEPRERPQCTEQPRSMEAESSARPDPGISASAPEEKPRRDQLYREKRLVECWSLNASKEFHGELQPMSHATKEIVLKEAILWASRERDPRWKAFL